MSLFRKLVLGITAMVIAMLLGNLFVAVHNSRSYFSEQIQALADDTATYLGISLSQAAKDQDKAYMQTLVNAVFDRGYYTRIVYLDIDGKTVVSRSREIRAVGVPDWFVHWADIPERTGVTDVVSGWFQLGKLYVSVHAGYAYQDLWRAFVQQLWLSAFAAVLGYALAGIGLKFLLRPLQRVETQAEAICRNEFQVQPLPQSPELRSTVLAMNRLVEKLQAMFGQQVALSDTLRKEVYGDPVTGLPNRTEFDAQLQSWVTAEDGAGPGVLVLLHVAGVNLLNDIRGREAGDSLLQAISRQLQALTSDWPGAMVARRAGCDFSIFVPGMLQDEVGRWLFDVHLKVDAVGVAQGLDGMTFWLGASVSRSFTSVERMLSAADAALRLAKMSGRSDWAVYPADETKLDIRPAGEWRDFLANLVQQDAVQLAFQPILAPSETLLTQEVFCRARDGGEVLAAGVFWPLAERFGFVRQLDQLILKRAVANLTSEPALHLAVNISMASLLNNEFVVWLLGFLQQTESVKGRLTLEFHERALALEGVDFVGVHTQIRACGVAVALDHFGLSPVALGQLQALVLAYVKIDRRFVATVNSSQENRFYIQTLVQIAHGCNVKIFADGVETEGEWLALQSLQIDGGQGYYLACPSEQAR